MAHIGDLRFLDPPRDLGLRFGFKTSGMGVILREGLLCSSFLGLSWFFGRRLEYTTQKGTT